MAGGRDRGARAATALGGAAVAALGLGLACSALGPLDAAPARADAVEPPPASCPRGTTPASSHAGPICRPRAECRDDAACGAGERCTPLSLCIEVRDCGGLRPAGDVCTLEHVVGECRSDGACAFGPCVARSLCVAAPAPVVEAPVVEAAPAASPEHAGSSAPPAGASAASTCRASAGTAGGEARAWIAFGAALGVLLTTRRRAGRRT